MKKITISVILMLAIGGSLAAQGYGRGYGQGGRGGSWGAAQTEESVSGRLTVNNGVPVVGGYTLIIPGQVVLRSGDNVEARGYVNGSAMTVTWLKAGADEYVFGNTFASGGFGGGFGGGPGSCPMMGGALAGGNFQEYGEDNLDMGNLTLE